MPSWKKVIISGSDASLNSLDVTTNVTASSFTGSFTGSFLGTASYATQALSASYAPGTSQTLQQVTTNGNTTTNSIAVAGITNDGNLFLSGSNRLVYNNDNGNSLLFGFFDGSSIYGPYYQIFGNNYSNVTQRGSAEYVFDTRNGGESGFNVAEFNGSTWLRKFRVSQAGIEVTGSTISTGGFTGSLQGTASYASQALSSSYALTASFATTASYIATASYTPNLQQVTSQGNTTTGSIAVASLTSSGNIEVNSTTIGRGKSNSLDTIAIGSGSLNTTNTVSAGVFIGTNAGLNNTQGENSVVIGNYAAYSGSNIRESVIIGDSAGAIPRLSSTQFPYQDVYIGRYSGYNNNGYWNTAIGYSAMREQNQLSSTQATNNVAVGTFAMYGDDFQGNENVGIGVDALAEIRSGSENIGIGTRALVALKNAGANTAIGTRAFHNFDNNAAAAPTAQGTFNTGLGYYVAYNLLSGSYNTFLGPYAGSSYSTGSRNVIIGYDQANDLNNTEGNLAITAGGKRVIHSRDGVTTLSGSVTATAGFTGSLQGTASFAITASYVATASYTPNLQQVTTQGNTTRDNIIVSSSNDAFGTVLQASSNGFTVSGSLSGGSLVRKTHQVIYGAVDFSANSTTTIAQLPAPKVAGFTFDYIAYVSGTVLQAGRAGVVKGILRNTETGVVTKAFQLNETTTLDLIDQGNGTAGLQFTIVQDTNGTSNQLVAIADNTWPYFVNYTLTIYYNPNFS